MQTLHQRRWQRLHRLSFVWLSHLMSGWALATGLVVICGAPAAADGCADLKRINDGLIAAARKEQAARDEARRLHDPQKTGRPLPQIPPDLQGAGAWAETPVGVLSTTGAPVPGDQAIARLQSMINSSRPFATQGTAVLEMAQGYQAERRRLVQELDVRQKEKQALEARVRAGQQSQASLANNADYKTLRTQADSLEQLLKRKIAIPGRLGLSVSTPDGILSTLNRVEDQPSDRLQELYLTSRLIQTLRVTSAVNRNKIEDLWQESRDLEGTALEDDKKAELTQAQAEQRELDAQMKAERERVRVEVQDDLSRLREARVAMARLEPAEMPADQKNDQRKLKDLEADIARRAQAIDAQDKAALARITEASGRIPGSPPLNLDAWEDHTEAGITSRGAVSELEQTLQQYRQYYDSHQARLKAVRAYLAWEKADVETRRAFEEKKRLEQQRQELVTAGAAALTNAQTTARRTRDVYVAEVNRRNGQMETARRALDEWNALYARRKQLEREAKDLNARGVLTEAQRARISTLWVPIRDRRDQFIARNLNGQRLAQMLNVTIPARKRDAQRELVISLRGAREGLKPFDCAEFPAAQRYLAILTSSINYHDKEPANQSGGSPVAGFMVISDLVLPPADQVRAVQRPEAATLTGTWIVNIRNSYATYEYQWDITGGAGAWTVTQTLRNTTHPFHKTLIGQKMHNYTLTARGQNSFNLRGEASDANPGDPGHFVQEGTGSYTATGISGSATHKGSNITDKFTFSGRRKP